MDVVVSAVASSSRNKLIAVVLWPVILYTWLVKSISFIHLITDQFLKSVEVLMTWVVYCVWGLWCQSFSSGCKYYSKFCRIVVIAWNLTGYLGATSARYNAAEVHGKVCQLLFDIRWSKRRLVSEGSNGFARGRCNLHKYSDWWMEAVRYHGHVEATWIVCLLYDELGHYVYSTTVWPTFK